MRHQYEDGDRAPLSRFTAANVEELREVERMEEETAKKHGRILIYIIIGIFAVYGLIAANADDGPPVEPPYEGSHCAAPVWDC